MGTSGTLRAPWNMTAGRKDYCLLLLLRAEGRAHVVYFTNLQSRVDQPVHQWAYNCREREYSWPVIVPFLRMILTNEGHSTLFPSASESGLQNLSRCLRLCFTNNISRTLLNKELSVHSKAAVLKKGRWIIHLSARKILYLHWWFSIRQEDMFTQFPSFFFYIYT